MNDWVERPVPWFDQRTGQPWIAKVDARGLPILVAGEQSIVIRDGIARFVVDDDFVESFGFQWNRFDVVQPEEDEATFTVKTGVPVAELSGLRVLDAGCGGGRYTKVAADHGATVVAVDRSRAIEKARALAGERPTITYAQADLTDLPLPDESFDLVFSIGVLHHSPSTESAFQAIARLVKPNGRLSVWVYRRNTWPQEVINSALRWVSWRLPRRILLGFCWLGAFLGGIPVLNRTLNKVVSFSNHPVWDLRVCDTFDWYSPKYQHHHSPEEVVAWFQAAGFQEIRELEPAKTGTFYRWCWRNGLLPGSGVNITGLRAPAEPRGRAHVSG